MDFVFVVYVSVFVFSEPNNCSDNNKNNNDNENRNVRTIEEDEWIVIIMTMGEIVIEVCHLYHRPERRERVSSSISNRNNTNNNIKTEGDIDIRVVYSGHEYWSRGFPFSTLFCSPY